VALSFSNKYYFYESDREALKKKYRDTFEIANKQRVLSVIENFKEILEKALKENRNPFPIYKLQKYEYLLPGTKSSSSSSSSSRTNGKKPFDQVFDKFMQFHGLEIIPTEQSNRKSITKVYQMLFVNCEKNEMTRIDVGK
jgi:hypothetical protein